MGAECVQNVRAREVGRGNKYCLYAKTRGVVNAETFSCLRYQVSRRKKIEND